MIMICPRWLVQSSAAGVVGVALIAMPLWMTPEEGVKIQRTAYQGVEVQLAQGPTLEERIYEERLYQERRRRAHLAERNRRAGEVRTHLYELYDGPQCPLRVELLAPEALEEARSIVEEGLREAGKSDHD